MTNFFKPEDFEEILTNLNIDLAANIANAKLEREGKVVYSGEGILLINIEPIEKCKHEKKIF